VRDVGALADLWADRVRDLDERFNPWQDGRASSRFLDVLERELSTRHLA